MMFTKTTPGVLQQNLVLFGGRHVIHDDSSIVGEGAIDPGIGRAPGHFVHTFFVLVHATHLDIRGIVRVVLRTEPGGRRTARNAPQIHQIVTAATDHQLVVMRVKFGTPDPVTVAGENLHRAREVARVPKLYLTVVAGGDQHQWLVWVVVHAPDCLIVCGGVMRGHLHLSCVHQPQPTTQPHCALFRRMRVPRNAALLHMQSRSGLRDTTGRFGVFVENKCI
mmetsp:Transcript_1908/g.3125  ORF Transcript_1908/g.3125 Transcript_1908/m.3125 type:complete len:222 (+) Transcript_1908:11-676(+)